MYNYDSLANAMDNIAQCTYDLILHDLIGNGWVGTVLEIYQEDDTTSFTMTNGGFNQAFTIDLYAPAPVSAKLFVTQQAQFTACLLYTSPSPRDGLLSRMPSSA